MRKTGNTGTWILVAIITAFALYYFTCMRETKVSEEEMKKGISQSFKEKTGYAISSVDLIEKNDYDYTGLITLSADNSQAQVDVTIDKSHPSHYMWKVVAASPLMIRDALDKSMQSAKEKSDSILKSYGWKDRANDSAMTSFN